MRKDDESRIRVLRMLGGDCRVDDISRLLRSLRSRTYGHRSIKDLADLTAHEDERDQGLLVEAVREVVFSARLHLQTGAATDITAFPAGYMTSVSTCLKYISDAELKRRTGLKRPAAQRLLLNAQSHVVSSADGSQNLAGCSSAELEFLQGLSGLKVAPAYSDDSLFDELISVLTKNGILQHVEIAKFGVVKDRVALFALSLLHRVDVHLPDGVVTELFCQISGEADGRKLSIIGSTPMQQRGVTLRLATAVFETSLVAAEHCEPSLLEMAEYGNALAVNPATWSKPIEISERWKLQSMS